MSVFKPNSNKNQDIGGVYGESSKIPQHLSPNEIPVRGPNNTYPAYQQCNTCSGNDICIVDQSGNPYSTDEDGCYIIPSGSVEFVDESGVVCIVDGEGTAYSKNGDGCFVIPQADLSGYLTAAEDGEGNFYEVNDDGNLVIPQVDLSGYLTAAEDGEGNFYEIDDDGNLIIPAVDLSGYLTAAVDESGNFYTIDDDGNLVIPTTDLSGYLTQSDLSGYIQCAVDESGNAYSVNASGCLVIPSSESVDLSGYLTQSDLSGYLQYAVDESGNFYDINSSGYLVIPAASGGGGISSVTTSGCISGVGTEGDPIVLVVDPSGGLYCTPSGLSLDGSGCGFAWSFESGSCPTSPSAPADPVGSAVAGTMQLEVFPTCMNFWYYDGSAWQLRDTFYSLSYSGDGSGIDCSQMTTLEVALTGSGTFATPYSAAEINVTQPCDVDFTIDNRDTVYFELGQGGFLVADGAIATQGRWVVPEGYELEVTKANWTLGASGTTNTDVEFYSTQGATSGAMPTPSGAPDFTLTIPSGLVYGTIANLEGTYNNLTHFQERVDVAGTGAKDLLIQVWARIAPID